ncbi:MAG: Fe-S cluster assembly scaffold protein NifU [Candidatus Altiarchaeales archaeon]|nr:Fe-S cluster assembly scaffold protein NifU [Candidatus Altiarchaeales archaeon]MBD3416375.1 Fe-S cluster assembly scaffold protein NifU [Candidatus Altiarchaeales archaeon]
MYSETVMDHFTNPRNMGAVKGADAVGRVGNPVCGDVMEIFLKVAGDRISDIGFKTMGCAAAIATSSMTTELAKGKTLDEALKISRDSVVEALDGLPPNKVHCSNLAADALHKAIANYRSGRKEGETLEEVLGQYSEMGLDEKNSKALWDAGVRGVDEIRRMHLEELAQVPGIKPEVAAKIKKAAEDR